MVGEEEAVVGEEEEVVVGEEVEEVVVAVDGSHALSEAVSAKSAECEVEAERPAADCCGGVLR